MSPFHATLEHLGINLIVKFTTIPSDSKIFVTHDCEGTVVTRASRHELLLSWVSSSPEEEVLHRICDAHFGGIA